MKTLFFIFLSTLLINSLNCSFQSKIFNKMNKDKVGENLIISPLSIFQALSLAANGAKEETLSEMLDLLESDSLKELNKINLEIISTIQSFTTLDIANAVMTRFTPLKSFIEVSEQYLAPVEPLKSVDQVNGWCSNKTHGKIPHLLDELSEETLLIILNAIYFKGEWRLPFEEESTTKLPFYNFGKDLEEVDTMRQIESFLYYEDKNVQAIQLRFLEDFMSAIIILPAEGTDINKYINSLSTSKDYNKINEGFDYARVDLQLPKFEVRFSENLNQILKDLGMFNAFNSDSADFSGLRDEGGLFISKVIHKTYLKVNEDGTEAAAVTGITMDGASFHGEEKIFEMKVNRPFLFLLKNLKLPEDFNLVFMSKIEKIEEIKED